MYGIFTNIGPKNHPNVGKYTIHGAYGIGNMSADQTLYKNYKITFMSPERPKIMFGQCDVI